MTYYLVTAADIHNLGDSCANIIQFIQHAKDDSAQRIYLMMEMISIKGMLEHLLVAIKATEAAHEDWPESIKLIARKGGPLDLVQEALTAFHSPVSRETPVNTVDSVRKSPPSWPFEERYVEERIKIINRQKLLLMLALDNDPVALSREMQSDAHAIREDVATLRADTEAQLPKEQPSHHILTSVPSTPNTDYCYSPLSNPGSIRLLHLLPHSDPNGPLRCRLSEYPLHESQDRTHLYEALSYVWGSEDNPQPVYIQSNNENNTNPAVPKAQASELPSCPPSGDESRLLVTANLHTALLHLRDPLLERIIWIDAICINQKDNDEKGQQVQFMAMIYARANRVIVWLGVDADDSNLALEAICTAAQGQSQGLDLEEPEELTISSEAHTAIVSLLEEPWFARIWVLQEVAAARDVSIKYGSMEISGNAFSLGLKRLKSIYRARQDLRDRVNSVAFLISGADFRPRQEISGHKPSRFSLAVRPLGELMDMYHNRKATNPLDKVYAFLGMCSDDPHKAGISADYKASWKEVFEKLIKFSIYSKISVATWDGMEMAVIRSNGCVVGTISSSSHGDGQRVETTWQRNYDFHGQRQSSFTLPTLANPVQTGDIVCLLRGARKPLILRSYDGYWTIVMIAFPLTGKLQRWSAPTAKTQDPSQTKIPAKITFPDDLMLIWDWNESRRARQDKEGHEAVLLNFREVPRCPVVECRCLYDLDRASRLWNYALLLNAVGEYEKAMKKFRTALKVYGTGMSLRRTDKAGHVHGPWRGADKQMLRTMDDFLTNDKNTVMGARQEREYRGKHEGSGQTPLAWAAEDGHKDFILLLLEKGGRLDRMALSGASRSGHREIVKLLLDKGADADHTALSEAARNGHGMIVQLLLKKGTDPDQIALSQAAKSGNEAVVRLLLEKGAYPDQTALSEDARSGHEAIVQLLLAKDARINAKDYDGKKELFSAAENGHVAVIRLLIEREALIRRNDWVSKRAFSLAARHGHKAVVQLLLEEGTEVDTQDWTILEAFLSAVENGHEPVVRLLLENGAEVDAKDHVGRTALSLAAKNFHEAIVQLLLEKGAEVEVNDSIFDERVLLRAVKNGHEAIVRLLLEYGAEVDVKNRDSRTALSLAAENGQEAIVRLLLEKGADISARDVYGNTALTFAARYDRKAVVRLLRAQESVSLTSLLNARSGPL